ncbi:MAG: hypothetical protein ABR608_08530 [Pseudonocardiaceae bacterium]
MSQPALHRAIVVVDVAGFTNPKRRTVHQLAVQQGLHDVLREAFAEAGVVLETCTYAERGDGALILIPPEISKNRLADLLPGRLIAALRRYNEVHSAAAAMQLRVGLHAGEVYQSSDGAVGQAVNLAFRILDAPEAKASLNSSAGVLALIVSDWFYREVVVNDPAADSRAYRQITVPVNEIPTVAWVRLPDATAGGERSQPPEPPVLALLPDAELEPLRALLDSVPIAQLPTLLRRAAGPYLPTLPSGTSGWDAFCYLMDVNAGEDGFPPALMFTELVADQLGGEVGIALKKWNDKQVRRLRLTEVLRKRRVAVASRTPVADQLRLVISVQHDGIDPNRYLVSHWRQDEPREWPPPRGETRMVMFDELEQCVDDLVVSAERAWAGRSEVAALEFVLPRALLNLPVHLWHKERESGYPRPLCLDYPVVVRSLERMRSTHWHRAWHLRWQTLTDDPSPERVYFARPADTQVPHRIDAALADPRWTVMVLSASPPNQPRPDGDELGAALRSGLPVLLWHPDVSSDVLREVVAWLVDDEGLGDLPARTQAARRAAFQAAALPFDSDIARNLVVLWDDPHHLVLPGQPPPTGGIADECERAS